MYLEKLITSRIASELDIEMSKIKLEMDELDGQDERGEYDESLFEFDFD